MYAKKSKSADRRAQLKLIIECLSDKQVDALLTLLENSIDPDFELSQEEELLVAERIARYERGESKTISADKASKLIREKLKKMRK